MLPRALVADHALFHLEADLRWIDQTQARLGRLEQEVNDVSEPILEARGVRKRFGPTEALRGRRPAPSRPARPWPSSDASGSGKSTLLYCLAGILAPDDGEVWFAGRRIDDLRERERSALRRRQFGFVFQFGQLVPELRALENVALPLLLERA